MCRTLSCGISICSSSSSLYFLLFLFFFYLFTIRRTDFTTTVLWHAHCVQTTFRMRMSPSKGDKLNVFSFFSFKFLSSFRKLLYENEILDLYLINGMVFDYMIRWRPFIRIEHRYVQPVCASVLSICAKFFLENQENREIF